MALTKISTGMLKQDAASSDLNIDAGTLYLDVSNNRVGIANTSPAYTLDISGSSTIARFNSSNTNAYLRLDTTSATSALIGSENGRLIFSPNSTTGESLSIASSGNVGIGLSSNIDRKLHVENNNDYAVKFGGTSAGDFAIEIGQSQTNGSPGFNATAGSMKFSMAGTEAMRIDSSGNLLVGKTSDSSAVSTDGINLRPDGYSTFTATSKEALQLSRQGTDGDILDFYKGSTSVGSIQTKSSDLAIGTGDTGIRFVDGDDAILPHSITAIDYRNSGIGLGTSNFRFTDLYLSNKVYAAYIGEAGDTDTSINFDTADTIKLVTGGSERMRIDSSGNVGIGTTSPNGNGQLTINSAADNSPQIVFSENDTQKWLIGHRHDGDHFRFYDLANSAERMRIDSSGNLLVGTTTYNSANQGILLGATGVMYSTNVSNISASFGRNTTDGAIVNLRKDNSTVGSIGNFYGYMYLGTEDTGLIFDDDNNHIKAWNPSTNGGRDAAVDLGASGTRFKDVYMSGALEMRHSASGQINMTRIDSTIGVNNSLGQIVFGGSEDNGTTINNSASIVALSSQSHTSTRSGGHLTFSTTANHTTTLTEAMRITSAGNVGIGTTDPSTRLSVRAGSANGIELDQDSDLATDSARLFFNSSSGGYSIFNTSGSLRFSSGATTGSSSGTERMRIDSSGNVGIGTTSPTGISGAKVLEIKNTSTGTGTHSQITLTGSNGHTNLLLASGDDTTGGDPVISSTTNHAIRFGHSTNSTFSGFAEHMRITDTGNVGIGTTSPGAKLEISGKDDAGSSDLLRLQFDNSPSDTGITFTDIFNTVKSRITIDSGNTNDLRISAGTKIHLYGGTTNGTTSPHLTVSNNGNVGIDTDSPTATLDVAGTALVENAKLKAIAESNTDTAVDVFVYDTRKDSDGGAWRKRTQHTSWYNETLNTSTRGARKEFPCIAVIVLESNKTIIYDGDDPDMPMWMTFVNAGSNSGVMLGELSNKCVTMLNGNLGVGSAPYDFYLVNFIKDKGYQYSNNVLISGTYKGDISTRNVTTTSWHFGTVPNIVGRTINDVAMTVLPNAPIDADTGLPVPTIALATEGGVSVIKDDGAVVDITAGAGSAYNGVSWIDITENNYLIFEQDNSSNPRSVFHVPIPSADRTTQTSDGSITDKVIMKYYANGSHLPYPCFNGGGVIEGITLSKDNQALRSEYGDLTLLEPNIEDPEQGKVAYIASDYNTGWMHGDIKLAALSDTDTTNVTGSELVTNGTFDSNVNGWTVNSNGTATSTNGQLVLTNTVADRTRLNATATTEVGKKYVFSYDSVSGPTFAHVDSLHFNIGLNTTGSHSLTFVARYTSTAIQLGVSTTGIGDSAIFDNVSIRLAEQDRSVNDNGLQVFGTVTKTAVATGAELVGYSGFSSSNYLQQPYNGDLNFGTGDFSISVWAQHTPNSSNAAFYIFDKADSNGTNRVAVYYIPSANRLDLYSPTSGQHIVASGTFPSISAWSLITIVRKNGIGYIYHNGNLITSGSFTENLTGDSTARLSIGTRFNQVEPWTVGSLALFRISGTAPTEEQIKKMYNDEKHLFATNAKATLYGSSDAVTALAYDDDTELLHVGTSAGRSVFQGLNRVNNTTDAVGAAISASSGFIVEE